MAATKEKPRTRRTPEEREAMLDSVLWHALERYAKKQGDRALLDPGVKHDVKIELAGHVDGRFITREIFGELSVDHDQTAASSSAPNAPHLVALLLDALPKTKRRAILNDLPTQFLAAGELPAVSEELLSAAITLLEKLRATKTATKRGNVAFRPTA